jgi:hypothetical protein
MRDILEHLVLPNLESLSIHLVWNPSPPATGIPRDFAELADCIRCFRRFATLVDVSFTIENKQESYPLYGSRYMVRIRCLIAVYVPILTSMYQYRTMLDSLATPILENSRIKNLSLACDFHLETPIKLLTPAIQQRLRAPGGLVEFLIGPKATLLPDGELLFELGNDLASRYPTLQRLSLRLQASTAPNLAGKTRTFLQSVHDISTGDIQCALDLHEREIELESELEDGHWGGRLA